MWGHREIIAVAAVAAFNIIYFVLMNKRWNLHLVLLLAYSLAVTGVCAAIAVKWLNAYASVGFLIALLYDLGITVHLIRGARNVTDVLDGH